MSEGKVLVKIVLEGSPTTIRKGLDDLENKGVKVCTKDVLRRKLEEDEGK